MEKAKIYFWCEQKITLRNSGLICGPYCLILLQKLQQVTNSFKFLNSVETSHNNNNMFILSSSFLTLKVTLQCHEHTHTRQHNMKFNNIIKIKINNIYRRSMQWWRGEVLLKQKGLEKSFKERKEG